ncbi:hypothetical protein KIPB_010042 [Kipferlia bialata]|uniref:Uncharacterized protein n=1 Tax=Kipferlia bialata TaxID=797122 RepID=A0A9K3D5X7_9EUKA|nr:hypothetical protein KIPB_010042 [Kipferlia bialata]|eukprot:g10042.t1
MGDDKSKFVHNLPTILDAWKQNNLYMIGDYETDHMYRSSASRETQYLPGTHYLHRAFCIRFPDQATALIVWVHSGSRRRGLASDLLAGAGAVDSPATDDMLPGSEAFWSRFDTKMSKIHPSRKSAAQVVAEEQRERQKVMQEKQMRKKVIRRYVMVAPEDE